MKSRFFHALILIILGLVAGYVWSDYIMNFVRAVFPSDEPPPRHRILTYDGWLT